MKSLFEFLRGTLVKKSPSSAVLEVNGIGFFLQVSANTAAALPSVGEEVSLFTYLHIREDALVLFGFASPLERTVFTSLLEVEGVGPRSALAVLSTFSASEVLYLVRSGDIASLVRVRGIGKKTAQRIVLELKEKFGGLISSEETGYRDEPPEDDLARAALLELGYRPEEVQAALSQVAGDLDPAARVRAALEVLRKR